MFPYTESYITKVVITDTIDTSQAFIRVPTPADAARLEPGTILIKYGVISAPQQKNLHHRIERLHRFANGQREYQGKSQDEHGRN